MDSYGNEYIVKTIITFTLEKEFYVEADSEQEARVIGEEEAYEAQFSLSDLSDMVIEKVEVYEVEDNS